MQSSHLKKRKFTYNYDRYICFYKIFISINREEKKKIRHKQIAQNILKIIWKSAHVVYLFPRILICIRYTFFPRFHLGGVSNWETFQSKRVKKQLWRIMKFIVPIFNQQYTRTESHHPRSEPSFKRATIFHSAVVISFCIIADICRVNSVIGWKPNCFKADYFMLSSRITIK